VHAYIDPLAKPQLPSESETPARHTDAPDAKAGTVVPLMSPHRSSVSQTPDAQIAVPTACVQRWAIGGAWVGASGMSAPFVSFAVHVVALHHSVVSQSASTRQVEPHAPVTVSQTGPAWPLPAQLAREVQELHAPVLTQRGDADGHARVAVDP
jgi:hypothetical protein